MKLLELQIDGFGKFQNRTISFQDGINILYGDNEAGKSTIHTFIRGMLFGIERGRGRAAKHDIYTKYEPWENSGTYQGRLRLEQNGTIYCIERRFRKDSKSLKIINETKGLEVEPTKALFDELLGGLNETMYNNTISIGQLKSATEDGMVTELKNYIANMNTTGNISLNISKATAFLRNQKRSLEMDLIPDASREYTALLTEIRSVETEISSPQYENQLSAYQTMRSQVKNIIDNTQSEKQALDEKLKHAVQVLHDNHFTDRSSIQTYKKQADDCHRAFLTAKKESEKKSRKFLMILCFLTALALTGAAAWMYLSQTVTSLLSVIAVGTGGILFLALGFVLKRTCDRCKRQMEENQKTLSKMLSAHLGNAEFPDTSLDASMDAFHGRMEEFLRLCDMIAESELAVKKYMEDINSLQEKQNSCSEMIEKQQRTQWELEKKLEHLNNCKNRAVSLKRILAENDRIREEITAIELAMDTMTELSSSIRDSFGLYLNKEASDIVSGLTGGAYDSMSIDENLNVFLNTKRKLVPLEHVSSGTMDQVYLALRLAAARLLQGDGEPFPLIFDDSFTQYDEHRLRSALCWLAKSYDGQMLIFTCHKREEEIMKGEKMEYHVVEV